MFEEMISMVTQFSSVTRAIYQVFLLSISTKKKKNLYSFLFLQIQLFKPTIYFPTCNSFISFLPQCLSVTWAIPQCSTRNSIFTEIFGLLQFLFFCKFFSYLDQFYSSTLAILLHFFTTMFIGHTCKVFKFLPLYFLQK